MAESFDPKQAIQRLVYLYDEFFCRDLPRDFVDVTQHAGTFGIDVSEIMAEIERICAQRNYHVGTHMNCTRWNVLPMYHARKALVLDRDHVEGLIQILSVEHGFRADY